MRSSTPACFDLAPKKFILVWMDVFIWKGIVLAANSDKAEFTASGQKGYANRKKKKRTLIKQQSSFVYNLELLLSESVRVF